MHIRGKNVLLALNVNPDTGESINVPRRGAADESDWQDCGTRRQNSPHLVLIKKVYLGDGTVKISTT